MSQRRAQHPIVVDKKRYSTDNT